MASDITLQLHTVGVAQVIVVLKPSSTTSVLSPAAAGGMELTAAESPQLEGLESCFESSDLSINYALSKAGMHNVAATPARKKTLRAERTEPPPNVLHFANLGILLGTVTRDGLSALRKDGRVKKVTAAPQPRLIRPVRAAPAKPQTKITWGISFLDVPKLWDQGLTGKGVRIAHLDTGADGRHPALKGAIAAFAEIDSFGVQVNPAPRPHDTSDHGTHTAATIAGRPVKGRSIGVAPGAELVSAIVIEGGNAIARILGGMDWAVSQNVRILNLSLGIPYSPPMPEFNSILQILRSRNILPIIAVGNEGPGTSRSPGNHPEAISVGAIDKNNAIPSFSSSQQFDRTLDPVVPDIVAPGAEIISAEPGGKFQSMDGSSMATPHISGLAALLFEAAPSATINDVENAIYGSCTVGGIPADRGNRGCPNAVRAFEILTGTRLGASTAKPPAAKKASGQSASKSSKKASKEKAAGKKSAAKKGGKKSVAKKRGTKKTARSRKTEQRE